MSNASASACFSPDGFNSYAPALVPGNCAPGTIAKGCKAARRYLLTLAAATPTPLELDPFQSLKVGAIVDLGSAADVSIDDWTVDGQSLFPKVKDESGAAVAGLGLVSQLTPELYRSGLNPLPPQPNINNTNPGVLTVTSVAGGDIDIMVYYVNP